MMINGVNQMAGAETADGIQFEVIPAYQTSVEFNVNDIYRTPREVGLSLDSEITMTNLNLRVAPTCGAFSFCERGLEPPKLCIDGPGEKQHVCSGLRRVCMLLHQQ
jgi:hypothetical protein